MFCPKCGKQMNDGSSFCAACGCDVKVFVGLSLQEQSPKETLFFTGHPRTIASFGQLAVAVITIGIYWIVRKFKSISVTYRLTSQRVEVNTGLFSTRKDALELYRVRDIVLEKPLGQRIMGNGNVVLVSIDKTTPSLRIYALENIEAIYERMRDAIEAERTRKGIRVAEF
jgi:uncharacterized membrane protein YdbT with pleckstrin-like domain